MLTQKIPSNEITPNSRPIDCADFRLNEEALIRFSRSQESPADIVDLTRDQCQKLNCPLRMECGNKILRTIVIN
ncbi:hypothetical protein KJ742_05865 [Patescibacteria group bacterium]|nr:hypothetical protein [Patescibacteria group bacterium]MBU1683442.1 hypothetical protein [Patescibacteria group bacterium]MBU1934988.1 hypothetical protein [Patescibacteria group bacterium]